MPEAGRYADQGYLDEWPEGVAGLRIIDYPGAYLAPWNIGNHAVTPAEDDLWVGGMPLVFFHFHRLKRLDPATYEADYCDFGPVSEPIRSAVYPPYFTAPERIECHFCAGLGAGRWANPLAMRRPLGVP